MEPPLNPPWSYDPDYGSEDVTISAASTADTVELTLIPCACGNGLPSLSRYDAWGEFGGHCCDDCWRNLQRMQLDSDREAANRGKT